MSNRTQGLLDKHTYGLYIDPMNKTRTQGVATMNIGGSDALWEDDQVLWEDQIHREYDDPSRAERNDRDNQRDRERDADS